MSNRLTQHRFEVSYEHPTAGADLIEALPKLRSAVDSATSFLERNPGVDKVTVYDIARKKVYTVTRCDGEAHSNIFIDNCGKCMPLWGFVVRPYSHALLTR